MIKLVLIASVVSLVFGNVQIKRQIKPFYKALKPTYAPTLEPMYEPTSKLSHGPDFSSRILRLDNEILPDGRYHYAYDTENGISADETGEVKAAGPTEIGAVVVQGSYRYTSPEGYPIQNQYVSDENGFHPSGIIISGGPTRL